MTGAGGAAGPHFSLPNMRLCRLCNKLSSAERGDRDRDMEEGNVGYSRCGTSPWQATMSKCYLQSLMGYPVEFLVSIFAVLLEKDATICEGPGCDLIGFVRHTYARASHLASLATGHTRTG
eukprot:1384345-Rhodomonas_salina.1